VHSVAEPADSSEKPAITCLVRDAVFGRRRTRNACVGVERSTLRFPSRSSSVLDRPRAIAATGNRTSKKTSCPNPTYSAIATCHPIGSSTSCRLIGVLNPVPRKRRVIDASALGERCNTAAVSRCDADAGSMTAIRIVTFHPCLPVSRSARGIGVRSCNRLQ